MTLLRKEVSIDHVLLTRFNLPTRGAESYIRAKDGWLQRRASLFEAFTIPSVVAQTISDFHWIVYFDPSSPSWLLERLAPHVASGVYTPIFRVETALPDVIEDIRGLTGARGQLLITTNLDNDDALAADFMERIQRLAVPGQKRALFLERGLIICGQRVYLRRDRDNAFCSVSEPWCTEPLTTWRDWHIMLRKHMPVVASKGAPAWLQVVHGENVSNRVRGRLSDPSRYSELFPNLIDKLPRPRAGAVAGDLLISAPIRVLGDFLRGLVKLVLLAFGGKQALDKVRILLRPAKRE
jgi:hypothetical protein